MYPLARQFVRAWAFMSVSIAKLGKMFRMGNNGRHNGVQTGWEGRRFLIVLCAVVRMRGAERVMVGRGYVFHWVEVR